MDKRDWNSNSAAATISALIAKLLHELSENETHGIQKAKSAHSLFKNSILINGVDWFMNTIELSVFRDPNAVQELEQYRESIADKIIPAVCRMVEQCFDSERGLYRPAPSSSYVPSVYATLAALRVRRSLRRIAELVDIEIDKSKPIREPKDRETLILNSLRLLRDPNDGFYTNCEVSDLPDSTVSLCGLAIRLELQQGNLIAKGKYNSRDEDLDIKLWGWSRRTSGRISCGGGERHTGYMFATAAIRNIISTGYTTVSQKFSQKFISPEIEEEELNWLRERAIAFDPETGLLIDQPEGSRAVISFESRKGKKVVDSCHTWWVLAAVWLLVGCNVNRMRDWILSVQAKLKIERRSTTTINEQTSIYENPQIPGTYLKAVPGPPPSALSSLFLAMGPEPLEVLSQDSAWGPPFNLSKSFNNLRDATPDASDIIRTYGGHGSGVGCDGELDVFHSHWFAAAKLLFFGPRCDGFKFDVACCCLRVSNEKNHPQAFEDLEELSSLFL